jgi:hypothetical protein
VTVEGPTRYVEDGFPAFDTGAEYLLFLYWNDVLEAHETAFGPDAAFRIDAGGRLQALGRGPVARQLHRLDVSEVGRYISELLARVASAER